VRNNGNNTTAGCRQARTVSDCSGVRSEASSAARERPGHHRCRMSRAAKASSKTHSLGNREAMARAPHAGVAENADHHHGQGDHGQASHCAWWVSSARKTTTSHAVIAGAAP